MVVTAGGKSMPIPEGAFEPKVGPTDELETFPDPYLMRIARRRRRPSAASFALGFGRGPALAVDAHWLATGHAVRPNQLGARNPAARCRASLVIGRCRARG